jgi:hypothetical protein
MEVGSPCSMQSATTSRPAFGALSGFFARAAIRPYAAQPANLSEPASIIFVVSSRSNVSLCLPESIAYQHLPKKRQRTNITEQRPDPHIGVKDVQITIGRQRWRY